MASAAVTSQSRSNATASWRVHTFYHTEGRRLSWVKWLVTL